MKLTWLSVHLFPKQWVTLNIVDLRRNSPAFLFGAHHVSKQAGRDLFAVDNNHFVAFKPLGMFVPRVPTVTDPGRIETGAIFALLALVRDWVMVNMLVLTSAAQYPCTFGNDKEEFTTFATIAPKLLLVVLFVAMPTEAP